MGGLEPSAGAQPLMTMGLGSSGLSVMEVIVLCSWVNSFLSKNCEKSMGA